MLTGLARCLAAGALAALALMATTARAADDALLVEGRALSEQFERGDTAAIFARMTPPMQQAAGGASGLTAFREKVLREAGPETGVIREDTVEQSGYRIYRRIARRNVGAVPVLMEWTLDPQGRIAGFLVRPQPTAIPQ